MFDFGLLLIESSPKQTQDVSSPFAVQMDSQGTSRVDGSDRSISLLQSPIRSFDWQYSTGNCWPIVAELAFIYLLGMANVGYTENFIRP